MKRIVITLAALAMMATSVAFAADGAAVYKAKCAACHGAAGEGKMGPAIKGKTVDDAVLKGGLKGPHAKPIAGVEAADAAAIDAFLK